jgi:hypothetical protein
MTNSEKQAAFLALQQGLSHYDGRSHRVLRSAEALDADELRTLSEILHKLATHLREESDEQFKLEAYTLAERLDRQRNEARGWLSATLGFSELHRRLEKLHRAAEYVVTRGSPDLGRCRRYLLEHLINARAEAHAGACLEEKRS